MLDGVHALAHCEPYILGADIVLEIDEGLGRGIRAGTFGSADHAAGPLEGLFAGQQDVAVTGSTCCPRHQFACSQRFFDGLLQAVGTVAGADGQAILRIGAGQEALPLCIEPQFSRDCENI